MARFHTLTVTDVQKTIRDAVVVSLAPPADVPFEFEPGQYLTFERDFDGTPVRRSYSICAARGDGVLQVGIKQVAGGAFSTWANSALAPGMQLEAMVPMGRFCAPPPSDAPSHYLAFAGGSGITPVLSIVKSTLAETPATRITLVYANRGVHTIMFRQELEDLKNLYMGRLNVIHILEGDAQEIELFKGRVDQAKCAALFQKWIDLGSVDTAFLCGPRPMMDEIIAALKAHGLRDAQIRYELFAAAQPGRLERQTAVAADPAGTRTPLSLTLDGTTHQIDIAPGQSLLEAARANALDAPFACTAGVCSTCKCKVLRGTVDMVANHALEDDEVAQGFVLSCQAYPVTGPVAIDYDQH